jgi:UDP-glucose 4-epimerase
MDIYGRDYDTPDGTCLRDFIHVTDLAHAHLQGLSHLRAGGESGVFNCGYGHGTSVLEVIAAVEKASGKTIDVQDAPRRPGDPAALVASAERIHQLLDWYPSHDNLDEIVSTALAWERTLVERSAAA